MNGEKENGNCICNVGEEIRMGEPLATARLKEEYVRYFAGELRKWWAFDNGQRHSHSWHSREDFIKEKLPELLDASGISAVTAVQEWGDAVAAARSIARQHSPPVRDLKAAIKGLLSAFDLYVYDSKRFEERCRGYAPDCVSPACPHYQANEVSGSSNPQGTTP